MRFKTGDLFAMRFLSAKNIATRIAKCDIDPKMGIFMHGYNSQYENNHLQFTRFRVE